VAIDDLVNKFEKMRSKSTLSDLFNVFGELVSRVDYHVDKNHDISTYVNECQFALVYNYILDENKSDRSFKGNSGTANSKADDFVTGLKEYVTNVCTSIIDDSKNFSGDVPSKDKSYTLNLIDDINSIRKRSVNSLAQSLTTKTYRYDSKALITTIYDALQKNVALGVIGKIFSNSYSTYSQGSKHGQGFPRYAEYTERQKALDSEIANHESRVRNQ